MRYLLLVYIPNQWIVFFAHSDWSVKLGIVSAIHLSAFFWISHASFPSFLRKKELFGACYPLVWYILIKSNNIHHSPQHQWSIFTSRRCLVMTQSIDHLLSFLHFVFQLRPKNHQYHWKEHIKIAWQNL